MASTSTAGVARRHEVGILLDGEQIKVVGADVDAAFETRRVRVSPRIARIPRWNYLPDGGTCVVDDKTVPDRLAKESSLERPSTNGNLVPSMRLSRSRWWPSGYGS